MHAILSTTDNIQRAIEEGIYSGGIFSDLRKAFDSVNHHILFEKIHCYEARHIVKRWFTSYLIK